MPDIARDPVYLWLIGAQEAARPGTASPAGMPARRPAAPTAADIARREGIDLGNLSAYQRRPRHRSRTKRPEPTTLTSVIRFATHHLRIPRETAVAHGQQWAASAITSPDEALEWITLLGLGGLDQALKLRAQGITPAQEKERRDSEARARLAARAAEDRIWADIAGRYRPGIAAQLRLNGCTPDMLEKVIHDKTADQLLREGRPVQTVINALREAAG
ncbi:hypothetical protein [Streptomyces sp. NPDC003688]